MNEANKDWVKKYSNKMSIGSENYPKSIYMNLGLDFTFRLSSEGLS